MADNFRLLLSRLIHYLSAEQPPSSKGSRILRQSSSYHSLSASRRCALVDHHKLGSFCGRMKTPIVSYLRRLLRMRFSLSSQRSVSGFLVAPAVNSTILLIASARDGTSTWPAAPIIHHPQEGLRYPHLKRAVLGTFRRAATRATIARHLCIFCITYETPKYNFYLTIRSGSSELTSAPPLLPRSFKMTQALMRCLAQPLSR